MSVKQESALNLQFISHLKQKTEKTLPQLPSLARIFLKKSSLLHSSPISRITTLIHVSYTDHSKRQIQIG